MLHLHGKRAHTLVVVSWNVQAFRSEVELIFRHGFRNFHDLLFNGADLPVHNGSYGWGRLLRLRRIRRCGALYPLSQGGHGENERCP